MFYKSRRRPILQFVFSSAILPLDWSVTECPDAEARAGCHCSDLAVMLTAAPDSQLTSPPISHFLVPPRPRGGFAPRRTRRRRAPTRGQGRPIEAALL